MVFEVLQQSVNGLFTAFTIGNGRSACFCQWCTQLFSVTTRLSGVQAAFQNHDFYFISVFQVFYFDVDELSPLPIITLQRNSALYMYAKSVSVKRRLRTADCGPGVKCRLSVKCRLQTESKMQARGKMQN